MSGHCGASRASSRDRHADRAQPESHGWFHALPTMERQPDAGKVDRILEPASISMAQRYFQHRKAGHLPCRLNVPPVSSFLVSPHDCSDEAEIAGGAVGEDDL